MTDSYIYTMLLETKTRAMDVIVVADTLILYEHLLCLGEEIEHFWSGPWTLSRVLYLSIRYLGLLLALITLFSESINSLASNMRLVEVVFCLSVSVTILCQAAITLRVWYLFSRSRIIRVFALTVFIMTTIAAVIIAAKLWPRMQKELQALSSGDVTGLSNLPPVWYFYVPSLIIHSTLFALKVYRFAISPSSMQTETLLWRFLKEGMLMYAFATGSLLFSVIGLSMMQFSQLPVHVAALEGSMVAATALISVCRATLSIGSLAATAHVDPEWLLNHAELSRVRWRRGAEGEIVVDVGEGGIPLPEVPVSPKAAEPLILGGRRR